MYDYSDYRSNSWRAWRMASLFVEALSVGAGSRHLGVLPALAWRWMGVFEFTNALGCSYSGFQRYDIQIAGYTKDNSLRP
jgi:hypothetical protein